MDTQRLKNCYLAEGVLCVFLAALFKGKDLAEILTLPFDLAGSLLRRLSLSGPVGNALAVALFVLLGLLPLLVLWRTRKNPGLEAFFLLLSCPLTWFVLYCAVNPGFAWMELGFTNGTNPTAFAFVVYGFWVGYAVLRWIRQLPSQGLTKLRRSLERLLAVLGAACILSAAYVTAGKWMYLQNWQDGAAIAGLLGCLVEATPDLLSAWVILAGIKLSADTKDAAAAEELAKRCQRSLGAIVTIHAAWNLLQITPISHFMGPQMTVDLPLGTMVLLLAALLLSSLLREYYALKEDSGLII